MTAPETVPPAAGPRPPAAGGTPRTWTIALPAGTELLNSNDRLHWRAKARITAELRRTAGWLAQAARVPHLERVHILAVLEPPDRRRRDPANIYPAVKACVDGLVDVRVLDDDDAEHLDGPDMRLGGVHPGGRLVLIITEMTGEA